MPETPTTQGYKALIKKLKKKLEHNYELLENKDMRGDLNDIEKVLRDNTQEMLIAVEDTTG